MNQKPSKEAFRAMLAACDDTRGDHLIWVGHDGEVHIDCLADVPAPSMAAYKFRYEISVQGNDYVGPKAAADQGWVTELWEEGLVRDWQRGATGFIDY